jgi:Cu+-exporting ATPase
MATSSGHELFGKYNQQERSTVMANHKDPVCGMNVDERQATGQSQYQGETYYFCSQGCKSKFDQNPQQYARNSGQGQATGQAQRGGSSR